MMEDGRRRTDAKNYDFSLFLSPSSLMSLFISALSLHPLLLFSSPLEGEDER